MNEQQIKALDGSLAEFSEMIEEHKGTRSQLLEKLQNTIKQMELDPDKDKATVTEAKINMINAVDQLLNSEAAERDKDIKSRLKKQEADTEQNFGELVTDYIKRIDQRNAQIAQQMSTNADNNDVEHKLDQEYDENCDPINEAETELVGHETPDEEEEVPEETSEDQEVT